MFGEAERALESSLKYTITMDDEFVTKSRNVSAGLLYERWLHKETMKLVNVWRQTEGNVISDGSIGEYHHLFNA